MIQNGHEFTFLGQEMGVDVGGGGSCMEVDVGGVSLHFADHSHYYIDAFARDIETLWPPSPTVPLERLTD